MADRWTWDERAHPRVAAVWADAGDGDAWCDALDRAAEDAVVGKVLCVCAALGVAKALAGGSAALDLLADWIDDSTPDRFDRICGLIFPKGEPSDLPGVVWWALRTATSTNEYGEAGWALKSCCSAALAGGLLAGRLPELARQEILARRAAIGYSGGPAT